MEKTSSTSSKKVVFNSVIYTVSGLLQKCASFFLLPLYTAYLTTEDYGITNLASNFIQTFSFVVAFSLFSAILRFYVDLKENVEKLKRFYGTIFSFIFVSGILFFVIFSLSKTIISKVFFGNVDYFPIIFICLLSLIFNCLHTAYINVLKSQQRAIKSSIVSFISFLFQLCLNIIFVVPLNMGAVGVLLATLISNVVFFAFVMMDLLYSKMIKICFDFELLKSALKYSIPIMPHNLSTRIAILVSSVLIGNIESLGALGVFSVSMQFGNLADLIQCYVASAYGPWLYEKLKSGAVENKENVRKTVYLLVSLIGFLFIGLSLFSQDYIILCVDKEFVSAWKYVPLIVVSYTIKTMYYFYVEILFYNKEASKKLFIATLTSSFLNVISSAFLIPNIGVYGSILSDAFSILVCNTIVIAISGRYGNIGLKFFDFLKSMIVTIFFIFIGLSLSYLVFGDTFSICNFVYKIFIILTYMIIVWLKFNAEIKILLNKGRKKNA